MIDNRCVGLADACSEGGFLAGVQDAQQRTPARKNIVKIWRISTVFCGENVENKKIPCMDKRIQGIFFEKI
jgi:hypothetical protein